MKKILFPILMLVLLAACASSRTPDLSGAWTLVAFGDPSNSTPALPNVETSIQFDQGKMGGNVGCNSFGGDYTQAGNSLSFGPIMSTEMYCEATSAQEQAVLSVFAAGGKLAVQLEGGNLVITAADGTFVALTKK
jgi:heat shock protein HslJ